MISAICAQLLQFFYEPKGILYEPTSELLIIARIPVAFS
jgi:hypothetical protein